MVRRLALAEPRQLRAAALRDQCARQLDRGVGGIGGIGQDLFVAIRKFHYTDVSAILPMIIVTVALLDLLTERIRQRLAPVERTA